jgi:hypothetical protein
MPKMHEILGTTSHSEAVGAAVLPLTHVTRALAGYSTEPTAVASPFTIDSVDITATVAGTIVGAGGYFCGISRDPLNAIMEYVLNPSTMGYAYTAVFSVAAIDPSVLPHVSCPPRIDSKLPLNGGANVPQPVNPVRYDDKYPADPLKLHPYHGSFFPRIAGSSLGAYQGTNLMRYTYLNVGEQVMLSTWAGGVALNITGALGVYVCKGTGMDALDPVLIAGATFGFFTPTVAGNYGFILELSVAAPTLTHCTMQLNAVIGSEPPSLIVHRPMPALQNRIAITGVRVNGCSLMVTPDSAEMAKGGRIMGVQYPVVAYSPEGLFTQLAGEPVPNAFSALEGSDTRDFEKGGYAFHMPMSANSYWMQTPVVYNSLASPAAVSGSASSREIGDYVSYINPPDGWLLYAVQTAPNVVGGAAADWPGGVFHVTYAWSVEYQTRDVWIRRELPPFQSQPLAHADIMAVLARAPQFHDNPFHWDTLKRWYNGAAKLGGAGLPLLVRYLNALGPEGQAIAAILRGLGFILPKEWK